MCLFVCLPACLPVCLSVCLSVCLVGVVCFSLFPTRQEGVGRFKVESTFAMLLHHTLLPERIPPSIPPETIPPSIPPEGSASGSRRVSRQRIPPNNSASGSRPVSCQSGPPVDPAQYPARVVCHSLARSAFCLPTCFLTRLLGWMLTRDGLDWFALCLPTCFQLSPHLFSHALAGLGAVTRFSGPHLFLLTTALATPGILGVVGGWFPCLVFWLRPPQVCHALFPGFGGGVRFYCCPKVNRRPLGGGGGGSCCPKALFPGFLGGAG